MKQTNLLFLLLGFLCLHACQSKDTKPQRDAIVKIKNTSLKEEVPPDKDYPERWIGDITHDPQLDDPNFKICDEVEARQYFNLQKGVQYEGEKKAIDALFAAKYKPINKEGETGAIRIRFLVNCKGETGRFRMIAMDGNYQEKNFDPAIKTQLMDITKSMEGWKLQYLNENPVDYYQYLIFKMENGALKEILP